MLPGLSGQGPIREKPRSHRPILGVLVQDREVSGERLPRLRRSSLRIETFSDFSAAPLVSSGPSRSRLPAGTRDSRKTRAKEYAHALVPTVYQGSFRRACGHMGKSRRLLARLFQAGVGIRVVCGFPRTRHFHQAKPCSFNPPSHRCPRVFYPQIRLKTQTFQMARVALSPLSRPSSIGVDPLRALGRWIGKR